MPMSNSFYHKELTDSQWNKIKFLFPKKKVGRPPLNPRIVFNAIMWLLRSGGRWRDLPPCYGNWNSIYHKFRQWCESGLFELLLHLINADAAHSTLLEIDSTFCKVHQSACCALKNQAIGVSRGGKNTKVHVLINERMQLLNVILTGGNIHDSQTATDLFDNVEIEGKKFLPTKLILAKPFVIISINEELLFVSRINQLSRRNTLLTLTSTNNETKSRDFFSASRTFATSLLALTN